MVKQCRAWLISKRFCKIMFNHKIISNLIVKNKYFLGQFFVLSYFVAKKHDRQWDTVKLKVNFSYLEIKILLDVLTNQLWPNLNENFICNMLSCNHRNRFTHRSFCMDIAFFPRESLNFDRAIYFESCSEFRSIEYCSSYFTVNLSNGYLNEIICQWINRR